MRPPFHWRPGKAGIFDNHVDETAAVSIDRIDITNRQRPTVSLSLAKSACS